MALLLKAINSSDTIIMFSSGDLNFPQDSGVIQIDSEIITYTTVYMGTMYGCTRGAQSTTPASHTIVSPILLINFFSGVSTNGGGTTQFNYRKPSLSWINTTQATIETGLDGISGNGIAIFPDGTKRTDSTPGHIILDVTQTAVLSGMAQSGLQTGTVTANTTYAVYAVKVQSNSTDFILVADTLLPLQANFSTINTNFGLNSWVYLGMIRAGDNDVLSTELIRFTQTGAMTVLLNNGTGGARGIFLATDPSTTDLLYTATYGTGATDLPPNIQIFLIGFRASGNSSINLYTDTQNISLLATNGGATPVRMFIYSGVVTNIELVRSSAANATITLAGWIDPILSNGVNASL